MHPFESGLENIGAEPILLPVVNAASMKGVTVGLYYGTGVAVSESPSFALRRIEWSFVVPSGTYELWSEYAADDYRPMLIQLDGQELTTGGLSQKTGGWYESSQTWRFELTLTLPDGPHILTASRTGDIPHIRQLGLLPVVLTATAVDVAAQRYLVALHPLNADIIRAATDRRWTTPDDISFPQISSPVVVNLGVLTPSMAKLLRAWGMSVQVLEQIGLDAVGYCAPGALIPELTLTDQIAEATVARGTGAFRRANYQSPFFQAGGLVMRDPFDGDRLISTHSFMLDALHIAYRFRGRETFYVIIGRIMGRVVFLSFPRLNALIHYAIPNETEEHVAWSTVVHKKMMMNILMYAEIFEDICRTPRRETGVTVGFWNNFGHYLWQDLAGLLEILNVHGPSAVKYIVLGPHSKLDVAELFPEIADRPYQTVTDPEHAFSTTLQLPYQLLRPISLLIQPDLRTRVFRVAERRVPAETQTRMADLAQRRFVVWITLRSHNKSWARQAHGHSQVLRRLKRDVGPLAVILDGMKDTREAADSLVASLDPDVEVIDTLGCGIYESFLWARVAHLYSTVVSTGLFFNSYFADRPGVAHANPMHLLQSNYWSQVSPGTCPPTFLEPSDVQGDRELYGNYDFDPDLLYLRLRELVERHYPDRLLNGAQAPSN